LIGVRAKLIREFGGFSRSIDAASACVLCGLWHAFHIEPPTTGRQVGRTASRQTQLLPKVPPKFPSATPPAIIGSASKPSRGRAAEESGVDAGSYDLDPYGVATHRGHDGWRPVKLKPENSD
jgi:hypothetical protein